MGPRGEGVAREGITLRPAGEAAEEPRATGSSACGSSNARARATSRALSSSSDGSAASIVLIAAFRDSSAESGTAPARRPARGTWVDFLRSRMSDCDSSDRLGSGVDAGGGSNSGCAGLRGRRGGGGTVICRRPAPPRGCVFFCHCS